MEIVGNAVYSRYGTKLKFIVSVLEQDKVYEVKYSPMPEFPRAKPKGTPKGKGLYLSLYLKLSLNTHRTSFLGIITVTSCIALKGR